VRKKPSIQKPRRPIVEDVEPRILYSADFSPGLLDAAHWRLWPSKRAAR
jgi:hypothetical protein